MEISILDIDITYEEIQNMKDDRQKIYNTLVKN